MFNLVVAASLQYVQKPCDITGDVGMWILRGVPYARLGGEMDDSPRLVCREDLFDSARVGKLSVNVLVVLVIGEVR
jgi:hypothetical protein